MLRWKGDTKMDLKEIKYEDMYLIWGTNTHATLEDLLDESFSLRCVSYQRKVGDWFFSELLFLFC
jgi:hypothetical protein